MSENPLDTYIDYPADLPRHINSDPTRIKQVLVNLLGKAIKFTPQGEVGIIVRLDDAIDHRDDEIPLRFIVKDSGIGIPKDQIDKIFESFTQVDGSTTRKDGGTGLGLTITKSIIEAMGGRIWVESDVGRGSQFIFSMKVKKGKPIDEWEIDAAAKKMLEGKTAFIIDDNAISLKVIKKTCELVGIKVLAMVDSGPAALAQLDELALKNVLPDVILCDILMSEMYGYEVAQKLRANKKFARTKIIAVTKISEADVTHYINDDCFNDYLTKPVIEKDLIHVLAKGLGYKKPGEETIEEKPRATIEDISKFKDLRILVAENNVTNFMLIKEYLDQWKCKVDYTYNGKEVIQRLETREYDVCLMDLQMPVLNGIEATKIIRSRISKTLPIIALTAAVFKEDRQKAAEAGMNDFLEKPLDIARLKEKILQYGRPPKEGTKDSAADQMKFKVLVVDDNSINLKLLTAFLKKLDCTCDTAVNGEEAVMKVKSRPYDICFMDIQMPVMSGVEATQIIREEVSQDLPIIAVTAVSDYSRERSLADGMNDFISKPVDRERLKDILSKHCHKTV
jgi:CheY-like chemotaxis protein